jgi:hypothetical protein
MQPLRDTCLCSSAAVADVCADAQVGGGAGQLGHGLEHVILVEC